MNNQEKVSSELETKLESKLETKLESESEPLSTDEEEYIDINDILYENLKRIYQIQMENEKIIIKHIGTSSHVPDIIIKEDFGKKNNLNLYSCIYTNEDIDFLKNKIDEDKFLPIIKLVEKSELENKIYSISIKIKCLLNYNEHLTDFSTYLTYSTNNSYIYNVELEKDINSQNIVEKMLEKIIELGITIL